MVILFLMFISFLHELCTSHLSFCFCSNFITHFIVNFPKIFSEKCIISGILEFIIFFYNFIDFSKFWKTLRHLDLALQCRYF